MKDRLIATIWRLSVFMSVCLLGLFVLLAVFAQLRFEQQRSFAALFTNVGGLKSGDFVRIAGVEVGKVEGIRIQPDTTARVEFKIENSVTLSDSTRAVIRYDNLYGDRYLQIEKGTGEGRDQYLNAGATIPLSHTAPALDLDTLIGGFRPLFQALDPDQVNALSSQLIQAFQGEGDTVGSLLSHTAILTSSLADRDSLIGQVINNLNTVLGSFDENNKQFAEAIEKIASVTATLAGRKQEITNAVAYVNAASASVSDLLERSRPGLKKVVRETDRTASLVLNDAAYFDDLINTLPDAYKMLGRQGLYGDWFAFYICEAILKVNGHGGQPVYIKLIGQTSGRCTPKP